MPKLNKVARFIQGIGLTQSSTTPRGAGPNKSSSAARLTNYETDSPDYRTRTVELSKIGRYGFPYEPTCLAVDPVQKLLAIGTANGAIKICGKPGVEYHIKHTSDAAVQQIVFLINEGGLVCACSDGNLHMWNLRPTEPELTHSLKFNKELLHSLHIPYGTKWLYVGTERGNVYIVNIETFRLSGYEIKWNHVIDVSYRQSPGPVLKIDSNPEDSSKLLLTYENLCVLWDLRAKSVLFNYSSPQDQHKIVSTSWGQDGVKFVAGYTDGSCALWNYRSPKKPEDCYTPHSTGGKSDSTGCCSINKVDWIAGKPNEHTLIVYSGGLPYGNAGKGVTLFRGRSKSLLVPDVVIDFCYAGGSPWAQENPDTGALVVLLKNEIIFFDLLSSGPSIPWFEIPYPFNIHDSPVTCLDFYPDCPPSLLTDLYVAESQRKKQPPAGQSKQKWPFTGGDCGEPIKSSTCVIVTGHADGSVKFWDACSNLLYPVCKISVSKLINRSISRTSSSTSGSSKLSSTEIQEDAYAVQLVSLCCESVTLAVACSSNFVVVYKYSCKEQGKEISRIEANFTVELAQEPAESPTEIDPNCADRKSSSSPETQSSFTKSTSMLTFPVYPSVRPGTIRFAPGFQPEVFCQQVCAEPSPFITCVALSSAFGVVAYGNALGVAIIDYVQKCCIAVIMNYELGVLGDSFDSSKSSITTNMFSSPNGSTEHMQASASEKTSERTRESRKSKMNRASSADHAKVAKKPSTGSNSAPNTGAGKDKEDGVFSFSKEKDIPIAGVVCSLEFSYSYTRKGGSAICPSLWAGTSTGSVTVVALSIPPKGEERQRQPVIALNTGLQIDMMAGITSIHLLDKDACVCPTPFEYCCSGAYSTPTFSMDCNEKHYLVLASEKRLKVKNLPSLKTCAEELPVQEPSFVLKTDVFSMEGSSCIACLVSYGHILLYSLPKLNLLKDVDCSISLNDYRIIRTFTFGSEGEVAYLTSPSEIQRATFSEKISSQYKDSLGSLFCVIQAPEPPQKGFFQSLFSPAPSRLDHEELFGQRAGSAPNSIADYTAGAGAAAMRAFEQVKLREEKLRRAEERTEELRHSAENFSELSRQLAEKMANKKWWQL